MKGCIRKIRCLAKAGKYTEALKLLETIPKQYMTHDLWVKRGIYIQLLEKEPFILTLADAKKSFQRAIKLNPKSVEAYIELGWFLYAVEDNAIAAEPYFRKAVKLLAKSQYEALSGIAECLSEIKDEQSALDFIKTTNLPENKKRRICKKIRVDYDGSKVWPLGT